MAIPQTACRWVKPLDVEPGHWKKQLAGKYLRLAERGRIDAVFALLEEHPEFLNKRGSHGRTLLWSAIRSGRLELVRRLLERGAGVNLTGCVNSESFVQLSPLSACTFYRRESMIALLEAHGAKDDLFRLTYRGDTETVLSCSAIAPECLYAEDPFDEIYHTPMITFAIVGNRKALVTAFIERGFDVTKYQFQLISIACHFGRRHILKQLFDNGATLDTADACLWAMTNDLSILRDLVNRGLSANQRPNGDLTPLLYVCRADKGTRTDKLQLLLELGADVSATANDGRTALHYAVMSGNREACELLLNAGVDPHQTTPNLPSATELAERQGYRDIATTIRQY